MLPAWGRGLECPLVPTKIRHQIMRDGRLCSRCRHSTAARLLGSKVPNQYLHHGLHPRKLLRRTRAMHMNLTSAQHVQSRMLSNSPSKPEPPPNTSIHSIFEELKFLFNAIRQITLNDISLWLLRTSALLGTVHITTEYGFKTFTCEGPSMEPTIIDGSFTLVLVERWSHRLFGLESDCGVKTELYENEYDEESNETTSEEHDVLEEWLGLLKGIWKQHFTSGLQRGDVIILNHPNREGTICKRIIGMPGDIVVRTDGGSEESGGHVAIPPGHFWIEGDNSLQSLDSREYGAVPASLTIGKVICRLWPLRDYAWVGMDGNGTHQWRRIGARIGRGNRPMPLDEGLFIGSHVLGTRR